MIFYNTHHAYISHNVRDQRWRACNWIWFHSLDDEQSTNWALSSASRMGHSNQSVKLKESSRHNVGLQHQKWSQILICTVYCYKVNSNVKCSFGKFSFVEWQELVNLMVMKNCQCSQASIQSFYFLPHGSGVMTHLQYILCVCVCAFWVCVSECIPVYMTAYEYLCVRPLKAFNPSPPGGALH